MFRCRSGKGKVHYDTQLFGEDSLGGQGGIHIYTYTHIYTHIYTYAHTYTYTHTHTYRPIDIVLIKSTVGWYGDYF